MKHGGEERRWSSRGAKTMTCSFPDKLQSQKHNFLFKKTNITSLTSTLKGQCIHSLTASSLMFHLSGFHTFVSETARTFITNLRLEAFVFVSPELQEIVPQIYSLETTFP